jgi:uncharacterized protein (DUF3084 family)
MEHYYGWLLATVLVLVSGLIAYLGDILGRRLGRRRITLFNLRPRHTAILISVVAGMLITILTLLAAAAVSKEVRIGFTRVGEMQQQLGELETKLAISLRSVARAKDRTKIAQAEREVALQELVGAQDQAEAVKSSLEVSQKKLNATTGKLTGVSSQLANARERYAAIDVKYKATEQALKKGEEKAFEIGRKSLTMEGQMKELSRQRDALAGEVSSLQKQEQNLMAEKAGLSAEVTRLTGLMQVATPALTEQTIFEVGHEIGRKLFPANQSIAVLRESLDQFVGELNDIAAQAGAGKTEAGRSVIPVRRVSDASKGLVQIYEDPQLLEFLARQIHAGDGKVVVRAFSLLNVPRGQPVLVELVPVTDRLLFSKGEKLGEITVNPTKSEAELLIEIVQWMREAVAQRARDANILPDLAPANEKNLLFGPTRYPVGRISPDRLFAILKEIKNHPTSVKVVARAAEDTWTVGPLQIDLNTAEQ